MYTLVIMIHTYFKVYEVPVIGYLDMANFIDLNKIKGENACRAKASLTKVDVHQRIKVIYIYLECHEILFSGYLDMAPD